ncbi:hypothetical protein IID24_04770 [Patescibacteria group bacterium]|nr:hypothetical protein [Patescibacteria group bacterium]
MQKNDFEHTQRETSEPTSLGWKSAWKVTKEVYIWIIGVNLFLLLSRAVFGGPDLLYLLPSVILPIIGIVFGIKKVLPIPEREFPVFRTAFLIGLVPLFVIFLLGISIIALNLERLRTSGLLSVIVLVSQIAPSFFAGLIASLIYGTISYFLLLKKRVSTNISLKSISLKFLGLVFLLLFIYLFTVGVFALLLLTVSGNWSSQSQSQENISEIEVNLEDIKSRLRYRDTYCFNPGIISLVDGVYEDFDYECVDETFEKIYFEIYNDKIAIGDLDDDGRDDVAIIIKKKYGGNGKIIYEIAIAVNKVILGAKERMLIPETQEVFEDSPDVKDIKIENGILSLDLVKCCPTKKENIQYILNKKTRTLEVIEPIFMQEEWGEGISAAEIYQQSFVLYESGNLIAKGEETYKRQLTQEQTENVIEQIRQSGIMQKECVDKRTFEYKKITTIVIDNQKNVIESSGIAGKCHTDLEKIKKAIGI